MAEFFKELTNWDGYQPVNKETIDQAQVAEAMSLLRNDRGFSPHRHEYLVKEAITTTDFPYLLGYIVDRQLLANYQINVANWRRWTKVVTNTNFNTRRLERVFGLDDRLAEVQEKGEYLASKPKNCRFDITLKKYGRQFDISWESIINDALGAFSGIATRFANAAIRTENYLLTSTYAMSTGPHTSLYGATITDCGQAVTNLGVLPLTIANLETTLELMQAQTDPNGEPISVRAATLVVPPSLEMTGRAILTSAMKAWTYGGDDEAAPVPWPTVNVIPQMGLTLEVDPYLPIVNTTSGTTNWYLFAEPAERPALLAAYLRGHESPEVVMKSSNKVAFGGGDAGPLSGDFATDNIFYRVREVFGTVQGDPRYTYAQTGAGS
ncbi:MAG: Mu-like prophage major head subunit gpT family protein [bacterium]|jgi:hypothetical protein